MRIVPPGSLISQKFSTAKFLSQLLSQASEEKGFILGQCLQFSLITVYCSVCLELYKKEAQETVLALKGPIVQFREFYIVLGNK